MIEEYDCKSCGLVKFQKEGDGKLFFILDKILDSNILNTTEKYTLLSEVGRLNWKLKYSGSMSSMDSDEYINSTTTTDSAMSLFIMKTPKDIFAISSTTCFNYTLSQKYSLDPYLKFYKFETDESLLSFPINPSFSTKALNLVKRKGPSFGEEAIEVVLDGSSSSKILFKQNMFFSNWNELILESNKLPYQVDLLNIEIYINTN